MRLLQFLLTGMIVLLLALALATSAAIAKDGRDFAGQYALTKTGEQGEQVQVTLVLHLMNYSGTDLEQAVIAVHPSPPGPEQPVAFAAAGYWRNASDVVASRGLTISRDEYQRWRRSQPDVFIVYTDDRGRERRAWAQLSRRPVIRETLPARH
jgi:hypothetical protein